MTPEEILKVEKDIVLTLKTIYDPEIPVPTARWPNNSSRTSIGR